MSINPFFKAGAGTGLAALSPKTVGARSQAAAPTQPATFKSALAASMPAASQSPQASTDSKLPGSAPVKTTASTTDVFSTGPGASKFVMSTPWTLSNGLALASGGGGNYAAGSSGVNEYGINYQVQPNGVVVYTDQRSLA